MEEVVVIDPINFAKVWLDGYQYRVIDTTTYPTVGELRKAMAGKLSVEVEGFDLLLEIGLSNGDKSTRIMDENEYVQQVFQKHKNYSNRLMWSSKPRTNASEPASKPETKYRVPPSRWSQVFQSMDKKMSSIQEGYQNLPAHWMALFKAMDERLWAMGERAASKPEVKHLITIFSAILLSLPNESAPEPPALNFGITENRRPKSLDFLRSNLISREDLKTRFKQMEAEMNALNVEVAKLKTNLHSGNDSTDSQHGNKTRLQDKMNLTLALPSSSADPTPLSPSPTDTPPSLTDHIPSPSPRPPIPAPQRASSPTPISPPTPPTSNTPRTALSPPSALSSPLFTPRVKKWRHSQTNLHMIPAAPSPDKENILNILTQAILEKRRKIVEEDEEDDEDDDKVGEGGDLE